MARLPVPGNDSGQWGLILNDYLLQSHTTEGAIKPGIITATTVADGSLPETKLDAAALAKLNNVGTVADGSITEVKLASAVQTKLNAVGTIADGSVTEAKLSGAVQTKLNANAPVTSVAGKTGVVTLVKADVGLAGVDNTSDASKPISIATQTALNTKADSSTVTSGLAGKANTTHTHAIADITNLQTTLDGKQVAGSYATSAALTSGLAAKADTSSLAAIATSGAYGDLSSVPTTFTPSAHTHTSGQVTDFTEATQDVIGSTLVAGTNVSLNYNDPAGTLTISATPGAGVTDLTTSRDGTTLTVVSSTGADAVLASADASNAGILTAADKTKLDGIASGAQANTVTSVASKTGVVTLVKGDVGLGNVDNTSDASKPISSLTQTALNTKEATVASGTTAQYYRGDKSWQTLDKTAVGLANVDNTTDANKPISSATQTALNAKADATAVGAKVMVYNAYADAPALPVNTVVISITGS